MSRTLQQIYTDNPITTNQGADLMYFARSPYSPGNDVGMLFSDFAAQFGTPFTPSALTKTDDTNVTLTLGGTPSTALLQATSLTLGWTGFLSPARGGTGVNNGTNTLTLAGNLATSGAFAATFTMTGATNVTFPTSGTLATTTQLPTPAALTKTDDTNVTLTLGGTPATALLQATSLTLGWTGQLGVTRGGSGLASATAYAVLCGGTTSTGAFQSVASVGTLNQLLASNGAGALPTFKSLTSILSVPTVQKFTSGSGTYTTPTSPAPLFIQVVMVGGGGGGTATGTSPGTATAGGNTTFGTTLLVANGGAAGSGAGGTASLGAAIGLALSGGVGQSAFQVVNCAGGQGAVSALGGGGGGGGGSNPGGAAAVNSGSGGGGSGSNGAGASGFGGSAGGYVNAIITSPSATYSYAVGAKGNGATAGTGGFAGGDGGSGVIVVYEYYQ